MPTTDEPAQPPPELAQQCVLLWRKLLGRDDLDADTHFFAVGGRSVLTARLVHEASRLTGAPVTMRTVLTAPTAQQFAARLFAESSCP